MLCLCIDTESFTNELDIGIKISIDVNEPSLIFKLARGHCSQNFIDEVFRSAQSKFSKFYV
jgi:hypothetical protein